MMKIKTWSSIMLQKGAKSYLKVAQNMLQNGAPSLQFPMTPFHV